MALEEAVWKEPHWHELPWNSATINGTIEPLGPRAGLLQVKKLPGRETSHQ